MKAFVVRAGSTGLDGLQLVERDAPAAGPGQILVEVKACSLNYRDLMIAEGKYMGGPIKADAVALSDGAGEVVAVGEGVRRFRVGDRVAATFFRNWLSGPALPDEPRPALGSPVDGMLAEYVAIHENDAVRIPANLSWFEAAALPCAGVTAWNALYDTGRPVKPGDNVLLLGTGGVSSIALQLARAGGARVIITSSSDAKLEWAARLGAAAGINYKTHPDWDKQVREATGGRGVDCVLEVGGLGTLSRSMSALAIGGKICMIGFVAGPGEANPQQVMRSSGSLHGVFVGHRTHFEQLNRAVESNDIHPHVEKVLSFEEAVDAYRFLQSQAHVGKVVISL